MIYSHKCIRCAKDYQEDDPDPYLCDACKAENKILAKRIDKKYNTVGQKPMSDYQAYEAAPKVRGFIKG